MAKRAFLSLKGLSSGLRYLAHLPWLSGASSSEVWPVKMSNGSVLVAGSKKRSVPFGSAAKLTGALLSGLMPYAVTAIIPAALRYVGRGRYTKAERQALLGPIINSIKAVNHTDSSSILGQRAHSLHAKISSSSSLTVKEKGELISELQEASQIYTHAREEIKKRHAQAAAGLIEEHVTKHLRNIKPTKQSVDPVLMMAGIHYLRGSKHGIFSLVERWQRVTREAGAGKRSGDQIKTHLLEGFRDWVQDLADQENIPWIKVRFSQSQALATLASTTHVAETPLKDSALSEAISLLLAASAQKLGLVLNAPPQMTATQLRPLAGKNPGPAVDGDLAVAGVEPLVVATAPAHELAIIGIPNEAIVNSHDNITVPMYRLVLEDPHRYGYCGNGDEVSLHQFAQSFVYKLAKRDGLLDGWSLAPAAARHIAIIPVKEGGVWRASFIDVQTSQTLNGQELVTRNILTPVGAA